MVLVTVATVMVWRLVVLVVADTAADTAVYMAAVAMVVVQAACSSGACRSTTGGAARAAAATRSRGRYSSAWQDSCRSCPYPAIRLGMRGWLVAVRQAVRKSC